jgi:hypothetical protein
MASHEPNDSRLDKRNPRGPSIQMHLDIVQVRQRQRHRLEDAFD